MLYIIYICMCFFVVQSYVCIQFVDFFIVYANIYDHIYIYIYTTSCLHTIFAICTVVQYINASCWYKFLVYIFSSLTPHSLFTWLFSYYHYPLRLMDILMNLAILLLLWLKVLTPLWTLKIVLFSHILIYNSFVTYHLC